MPAQNCRTQKGDLVVQGDQGTGVVDKSHVRRCGADILTQGHHGEQAQDPDQDQDGFHSSGCDVAQGGALADPLYEREDHHGGGDATDRKTDFQQRPHRDPGVLAASGHIGGVVQQRVIEPEGGDREDERAQEPGAHDVCGPLLRPGRAV